MTSKIAAVFDGQVFRPTEPIELPVNTRVQITIETLPPGEQETASFLQTARSLNLEGPSDWSANVDKYLYEQAAFHQALLESGLVRQIKSPSLRKPTERHLVEVQSQPISETILEERR